MKEKSIVKLKIVDKNLKKKDLNKDNLGIILKSESSTSLVLFFNKKIVDDYLVININNSLLEEQKERLPDQIVKSLTSAISNNKLNLKKQSFKPIEFEEYSMVRLSCDKEKYLKFGIHKGEIGVIVENYAINNEVLVDFSGVDKNGKFYGDCIAVNINDLEFIKTSSN